MGRSTRLYSPGEQIADRILHRAAIGVAAVAVPGLLVPAMATGSTLVAVGVALYGLGLLTMLVCSAASNHDPHDRSPRTEMLERLDHAGILLMIAGTYAPFALATLGGARGWTLFAFVWAVAVTGIVLKLVRRGPMRYGVSIALYLLLGWSVLPVIGPLTAALPGESLALLAAGGLLYSAGVVFFLWSRLPYHTVVWHGFVVAAASCHYAAVLTGVVFPSQLMAG